jgi:hypothetical protein
MPHHAVFRDLEPPIASQPRQAYARQAFQARPVLQPGRPPMRADQSQPVQRRSAAGFEIRLVPHRAAKLASRRATRKPRPIAKAHCQGVTPMLPDIPPQVMAALAEAPLVLVLLWMMTNLRREVQGRAEPPPAPPPPPHDTAREDLAAFKLEVARAYVPLSLIRDLDARLTQQLSRLEEKLDEVSRAATTAAAISAQQMPARSIGFATRAEERRP